MDTGIYILRILISIDPRVPFCPSLPFLLSDFWERRIQEIDFVFVPGFVFSVISVSEMTFPPQAPRVGLAWKILTVPLPSLMFEIHWGYPDWTGVTKA